MLLISKYTILFIIALSIFFKIIIKSIIFFLTLFEVEHKPDFYFFIPRINKLSDQHITFSTLFNRSTDSNCEKMMYFCTTFPKNCFQQIDLYKYE